VLILIACPARIEEVNLSDARPSEVDYSFVIWTHEIPDKIPAGQVTTASITLINNGRLPWISTGEKPYALSYHWKHPGGRFNSDMFWGERTLLPPVVGTGEMVTVDFAIVPPAQAKYYDLTIDIVRGKGRERDKASWFEELGWMTYNIRLEVVEQ
jgi:hypothetical protein